MPGNLRESAAPGAVIGNLEREIPVEQGFCVRTWVLQLRDDIAYSRCFTVKLLRLLNRYMCKLPKVIPASSFATFMFNGKRSNVTS